MSKKNFNLKFSLDYTQPIVIVTEPFKEQWNEVSNLINSLIVSLLGRVYGFYFLGNGHHYSIMLPEDFTKNSPQWFYYNKNRTSLIRPVFEDLEKKGFNGTVVVLCSKPPVDVEDWVESEVIKRTLFVTLTNNVFPDVFSLNQIESSKGLSSILAEIENPVSEIWITSEGFVPLCFEIKEGGNVKVDFNNGRFFLEIIPEGAKLDLHLRAISNVVPELYLKRKKGNTEKFLGQKEQPWCKDFQWKNIPTDVQQVVKAGINKTEYHCEQCGKKHPYDVLICPEGSFVLTGIPRGKCVLFKKNQYVVLFDYYAWPLRNNQRIITREGMLYEWRKKKWEFIRKIKLYEEVDNEVWGLYY